MEFPYKELKAKSGSISGFIFENPNVGLKRGLFLSIEIRFSPVKYGEEEWECSLASEWIPFRGGSWKEIGGIDFSDSPVMEMNETTFYMVAHDWCKDVSINISHEKDNQFRVQLRAKAEFSGYYGDDRNSAMPIEIDILVPFTGFTIMRDNLFPKPSNVQEAVEVAAEFIDTASFQEPSFENGVFNFAPEL